MTAAGLGGKVAELGDHAEVFNAAQVGVEMRLFGDVAHALLVGDEVLLDGLAFEEDFSGAWVHESGDHLHGGGFAGAVGAEVAGDFAGPGGEAGAGNGGDSGEAFVDVAEFEHDGSCR